MPLGSRHRLVGRLLRRDGALVLAMDDGGTWRLDAPPGSEDLIGSRVEVDGVRACFDLLEADRVFKEGIFLPVPEKSFLSRLLARFR